MTVVSFLSLSFYVVGYRLCMNTGIRQAVVESTMCFVTKYNGMKTMKCYCRI